MKSTFLVTGQPGCGKTTLIRQVVTGMHLRAAGFYTEDLRHGGVREGFRIVTLDGEMALIAAAGHAGSVRVSKYGVDLQELERVGVAALRRARERGHVLVVDEIGRMQLFSGALRQVLFDAVRSGHPVLGTIMLGRNAYADRLKRHSNVELLTLTSDNRQEILKQLRSRFV